MSKLLKCTGTGTATPAKYSCLYMYIVNTTLSVRFQLNLTENLREILNGCSNWWKIPVKCDEHYLPIICFVVIVVVVGLFVAFFKSFQFGDGNFLVVVFFVLLSSSGPCKPVTLKTLTIVQFWCWSIDLIPTWLDTGSESKELM